jgi:glycine cleavage system aminomethyltransferase T
MALRTPLYDRHVALGARMVEFGGYEMPLQYSGIRDEHLAVRHRAGLFDISHMGQVLFGGTDALANVQRLLSNDIGTLAPAQSLYSVMCNDDGGIIDDVVIARGLDGAHFIITVNAATRSKDVAWMRGNLHGDVDMTDLSDKIALIALQGPRAIDILTPLTDAALDTLQPFGVTGAMIAGIDDSRVSVISRTGYTGEDRRIAVRIDEVQGRRTLGTESLEQAQPLQLGVPVECKPEREGSKERQGVRGSPRLRGDADKHHLWRTGLAAAEHRSHPRRVGVEHTPYLRLEQPFLLFSDLHQSESSHEAVGFDGVGAGELRDPTGCEAAVQLQLPAPVLGVDEADGEARVLDRLGVDVGHAVAVADDAHRGLDAVADDGAADPWLAAAEEQVMGDEHGHGDGADQAQRDLADEAHAGQL